MSRIDIDRVCPFCATRLTALDRPDAAPPDLHAFLCGRCGHPLYMDADGTVRKMTKVRANLLPPQVRAALAAQQRHIIALQAARAALQQPRGPTEAPKHDKKVVYE